MFMFALVLLALAEGGAADPVAYTATRSSEYTPPVYSGYYVVRFNNVTTDENVIYNSNTGRLNIGQGNGGTYWVSVRVVPVYSTVVSLTIVVDGEDKLKATGEGVPAGVSAALSVRDGGYIEVRMPGGDSVEPDTMLSVVKTMGTSAFTGLFGTADRRDPDYMDDTDCVIDWPTQLVRSNVGLQNNKIITVRSAGVYLISIRADGDKGRYEGFLQLRVFINNGHQLTAYSEDNKQASAVMAWPMKANDTIQVRNAYSIWIGSQSLVSVVQVGRTTSPAFTGKVPQNIISNVPVFFRPLKYKGNIYSLAYRTTTITETGVYVACLRPDGEYDMNMYRGVTLELELVGERTLMVAYSRYGIPQAVCGAFYLDAHDRLYVNVAQRTSRIETGTLYSIARVL